ncbi:LOW QUALITY PROTEIN: suppressor of cytokine signaling 7-like [Micropterus salmoides]|uniref:LOW QUALITY PROTEIN: suppressor of cytokine signaling 7-like n=1 Tax=Micropterus salmoides TaxID=27706 RepID=UPI0018ED489B|nr:LOW QUALITY PROTEIN: suppressor of cytokine signaling 7-like [Micropterus salmoides]
MNDAQQEMSPDFVLMRLVSAAEYDRLDEPDDLRSGSGGFGPVKSVLGHRSGGFDVDPGSPAGGLGSASPHYSSPLPGKGELDGGLLLTQAPPGSEAPLSPPPPEDFAVAAQRFVDYPGPHGSGGHGSRAQLMVFQNLLRSGDRILECGLEQPPGFLQEETERQRQQLDSGPGTGPGSTTAGPGGGKDQNSNCIPSAEENLQPQQSQLLQWHPVLTLSRGSDGSQTPQQGVPVLDSESGSVLCHRHRLLTDRLAKWPPGLLDQALRLGLLEPRKNCSAGGEDPVLALARRLGQLGEGREGGGGEMVLPLPRCSCHSVLSSGTGGPGEDPSETSDALLVLEGLGSEEVGRLGEAGDQDVVDMGDAEKGERVGGVSGGAGAVFSSGTLSGLMRQVHRLAEEAGVCTDQNCRSSLAVLGAAVSLPPVASGTSPCPYPPAPQAAATPCSLQLSPDPLPSSTPDPSPRPPHQHQSRSQPQSRATTPKLGVASGGAGRCASPLVVLEGEAGGGGRGEKTPRGKSRKAGSLKVRLSKLFRTKSSSGGSGGLLDKRPSLASSTSSGGSLLDVWGSTCSNTDQDSSRLQVSRPHSAFSPVPFTPAFTGETVSLVDVDISRRGGNSIHPPTPPPPPRRSLSLLDDFGVPPQQQGPFMERSVGASMQSLPPRPLVLPTSLSTIQHSLSLNDTFLRGLPRPVPLRPDGQHPPPRLVPRCPLGRPDAGSFATSLRELEKCGWYWGPMNWEDAEMKLKGKPDGSFLVRDSSDPRYILSLSFRSQGVTHHTRMEHYRGTFSLWCHPKFEDRCHSVVEFIERAIMHSKNGKFLYFLRSRVPGLPPTPVQLLYPVSRFSSVKSLQHLCRFCIRQLVRIDHIQELPLPTPLISYLRKFYYYDPEEEIHPSLKERGPEPSSQPGVQPQT